MPTALPSLASSERENCTTRQNIGSCAICKVLWPSERLPPWSHRCQPSIPIESGGVGAAVGGRCDQPARYLVASGLSTCLAAASQKQDDGRLALIGGAHDDDQLETAAHAVRALPHYKAAFIGNPLKELAPPGGGDPRF